MVLRLYGLGDDAAPGAGATFRLALADPLLRRGDHLSPRHGWRIGGDAREGTVLANAALTDESDSDQVIGRKVVDEGGARVWIVAFQAHRAPYLATQRQGVLADKRHVAGRGAPIGRPGGMTFLAHPLLVETHVAVREARGIGDRSRLVIGARDRINAPMTILAAGGAEDWHHLPEQGQTRVGLRLHGARGHAQRPDAHQDDPRQDERRAKRAHSACWVPEPEEKPAYSAHHYELPPGHQATGGAAASHEFASCSPPLRPRLN